MARMIIPEIAGEPVCTPSLSACEMRRKPNRKSGAAARGYHDRAWGQQMIAVGLMPSHTGRPGGRRTGYRMSHYVIERGPFDLACRELLIAGERINWRDAQARFSLSPGLSGASAEPAPARNTRTRFICPLCDVKAWSRASTRLACSDCNSPLLVR